MAEANAIFVVGRSPAVLTETLAAAHARHGMVFGRVRVVSTRAGAEGLRRALFDVGGWEAFLREWPELAGTRFTARDIVAIDADDVRTADENRAMLDRLARELRALTETDTPLLASLAGGRKTMGYYMGFMMGFFARPGDRLCHVLAPEEWERDPDFLVPPRDEAGRIDLVDVPFIRLRGRLGKALKAMSADALLESAQTAVDMGRMEPVHVNYDTREVRYLGKRITLPPREFTFFQFFIEQKRQGCREEERASCEGCSACYLGATEMAAERHLSMLRLIRKSHARGANDASADRTLKAWRTEEDLRRYLPELKNELNRMLAGPFGLHPLAECLQLEAVRDGGYARYGLALDKGQIRIEE